MVTAEVASEVYRVKAMPGVMGIGKTTFHKVVKAESNFPRQIRISERARGYRKSEVHAWMDSRKMTRSSKEEDTNLTTM